MRWWDKSRKIIDDTNQNKSEANYDTMIKMGIKANGWVASRANEEKTKKL